MEYAISVEGISTDSANVKFDNEHHLVSKAAGNTSYMTNGQLVHDWRQVRRYALNDRELKNI